MAVEIRVSTDRMSGPQKAAIMLMSIDEESSAAFVKQLQEPEIERLAREIANLGSVSAEMGEAVLLEAQELVTGGYNPPVGGVEGARRLLGRAVGNDQSRRILDRVKQSFPIFGGFAGLQKVNPQQLSKFILGEHPQTVALILAHLNPSSASLLLTQLPDDMRADVLMRMASMEDIPPDVIDRVSGFIDQRIKSLGGAKQETRGGLRSVADLFNRLDRGVSRPTLELIESSSPDMAVAIRNLMFVFDDLVHVEDNGVREIVNRADRKTLVVALKGASEDVRQRFFQNMAKRAADLLREEMEVLGAVRLREVEKAQHDIVGIARKMEEEGAITLGGAAGEPYVV